MQAITSRDNSRYKEIRQLALEPRSRRKAGKTVLDGIHLCQAYLQHVGTPQICVVSESAMTNAEVQAIVEQSASAGALCLSLPDALYKPLSQVENGVGILCIVPVPHPAVPAKLTRYTVLLDQIQDPGNLGSILRSAAAAGIEHIFCSPGTAAAWSPRVLRAGMGAHFQLTIIESAELLPLIETSDIPVLATSPRAAQSIYDVDLRQPVAWLFGHEGQGISDHLQIPAAHLVSIPHLGEMESLNVAASAAVCFFEQVRQKR